MKDMKYPGLVVNAHCTRDAKSKDKAGNSLDYWTQETLEAPQWIAKLEDGKTIQPSEFSPKPDGTYARRGKLWKETYFVCADADNIKGVDFRDDGTDRNPDGLEPWTDKKGLSERYPNLKNEVYAVSQSVSSMSHDKGSPHRRYRLIFLFDNPITSIVHFKQIISTLIERYDVISSEERSPVQPVFGNAREDVGKATILGNILKLDDFPYKEPKSEPNPRQRDLFGQENIEDIRDFLNRYGIAYTESDEPGKLFVDCPNKDGHTGGINKPKDAYVLSDEKGWGFYCSHASCADKRTWDAFRESCGIPKKNLSLPEVEVKKVVTQDNDLKELSGQCEELIKGYEAKPDQNKLMGIIESLSEIESHVIQAPLIEKLLNFKSIHKMGAQQIRGEIKAFKDKPSQNFDEDRFFGQGFDPKSMTDELVADGNHYLGYAGNIFRYENGVYVDNEVPFEQAVRDKLASRRNSIYVKESRLDVLSTYNDQLDDSKDIMNFKSCLLDMNTGEVEMTLKEHSPSIKSLMQFPVDVKDGKKQLTNGKCEDSLNFITELVGDENVKPIMEMIGSIFHNQSPTMQTGFILTGAGSNGKSTLLKVITAMVGADNICATSWDMFDEDKYATYGLIGKALALDGDYQGVGKWGGSLKVLVEDGTVYVQQKNQKGFHINPQATMICACNDLPITRDTSHGFFRRFHLIPFPNEFKKDAKKEREILDKLTAPEELNAFAVLCVLKYRDAWTRGYFTTPAGHDELLQEFQELSNPIKEWFKECVTISEGALHNRTDVYVHYVDWCDVSSHNPLGRGKFYKKLRDELKLTVDENPGRYDGFSSNFRAVHNIHLSDVE